jgi:hypothetical protein
MLFGKRCCRNYYGVGGQAGRTISFNTQTRSNSQSGSLAPGKRNYVRYLTSANQVLGILVKIFQLMQMKRNYNPPSSNRRNEANRRKSLQARSKEGSNTHTTQKKSGSESKPTREGFLRESELERLLNDFPLGRTTILGFIHGFWVGAWGGIQENQARLTNVQRYDEAGNIVGNPQDIMKMELHHITYVV